jgi:hypothetical protein
MVYDIYRAGKVPSLRVRNSQNTVTVFNGFDVEWKEGYMYII